MIKSKYKFKTEIEARAFDKGIFYVFKNFNIGYNISTTIKSRRPNGWEVHIIATARETGKTW